MITEEVIDRQVDKYYRNYLRVERTVRWGPLRPQIQAGKTIYRFDRNGRIESAMTSDCSKG